MAPNERYEATQNPCRGIGFVPQGREWSAVRKALGGDGLLSVKITGTLTDPELEQPDPAETLKKLLRGGGLGGLLGR